MAQKKSTQKAMKKNSKSTAPSKTASGKKTTGKSVQATAKVAAKAPVAKAAAKKPNAAKTVKAEKPVNKAIKASASKVNDLKTAEVKTEAAPKGVAAKTAVQKAPKSEKPKQTKKQALAASEPLAATATETQEDKNIKKAKKALGRAQQSLAKARAKDFGSKLGKNLINQGMDELTKKWESLFKKSEAIDSKPYKMKDSFEERTAIVHKTMGWGFVLSNQNDRLEVLFRDGIRYLISNYKT